MYAVLFDIDGTLIQSGGAGKIAFAQTFREDFQVDEIPNGVGFAGRSDRAIAEEIMQLCGVEASTKNWERFTTGYVRRLAETLPQCVGNVLPGVIELLDHLDTLQHVAVGLLTGNIVEGAKAKLGHYDIAHRFAFGGYGDHWTDRNDIAAEARRVATSTASTGELYGAMVVGDTVNDVRCAKSIGAFAVAVATGGATQDELAMANPDLLLSDLTNSDALLAEITAS